MLEYDAVDSTNDVAVSLARRGARSGLIVRSDYQRRGRGQGKHRWYSPKGKDLLCTFLLRPKGSANGSSHLTALTCQGIRETLASYIKKPVTLKLPNDVLAGGRKIAGVLIEGEAKGRKQEWACVGIGLNVNTGQRQIYPNGTSIYIENSRKEEIKTVIDSLSNKLSKIYGNL